MEEIPFNKPFLSGKELDYINDATLRRMKISGNGYYSKWCQLFFESQFGIGKALLTTSCTDALEMAAILLNIGPGDEVIVPSFTFVSTANAFILRGAKIVFADCHPHFPNIDPNDVVQKVSSRTKAIVVVHYSGVACDMDPILELAKRRNLYVVEDAAQAIDSQYKGKYLGSLGDLSAFSFHETKNIICGEGGMLGINNSTLAERAEIIWEKGTNRSSFSRGEVSKYSWIDVGSSFLPSEILAAFLKAQLESIDEIQAKRRSIWRKYHELLNPLSQKYDFRIPLIPRFSDHNGHIFFVVLPNNQSREALRQFLVARHVSATTHYLPLEESPFSRSHPDRIKEVQCPSSKFFSECLLRLPLYFQMTEHEIHFVVNSIKEFFDTYRAQPTDFHDRFLSLNSLDVTSIEKPEP